MAKRTLTDRTLKALKPAPAGKLEEVWDIGFPGFGVRVSDTGRKTFVLAARYPGSPNPARRALGQYGRLTLEEAREKARQWHSLIKKGIDPAEAEEEERRIAERKRKNSFAAVAEDFIREKLSTERKGKEVERDIRNNMIPAWGRRPVSDVSDDEIASLIKTKARTAPNQARNLLGTAKRLFQWAIDQRAYGIKTSPAAQLKPKALCGEKIARSRVFSDRELFAFWRAAKRLPYPYGPVYRFLVLSGLRLNEVADAAWSEFHPDVARAVRQRRDGEPIDWAKVNPKHLVWTIPAARMKGKESKARAHVVPLTRDMLSILDQLPLFKRGDFLFSTSFGERPVWMSDKVKKRMDSRMRRTLQAMARRQGDDLTKVTLEPWTNHDLRRVVRSGLSRLRIAEEIREAVLAHVRPGIKGTYDVYDYLDEKCEALELWGVRLRGIVEPPPANVVALKHARA